MFLLPIFDHDHYFSFVTNKKKNKTYMIDGFNEDHLYEDHTKYLHFEGM